MRTKSTRGCVRWRIILHRPGARDVRADHHRRWRLEDLGDDRWRIGFTSNPRLAPVFTRWITNTESCASQISQWAAVEAIGGRRRPRADEESFLEARDLIVGLLNEVPGVTCLVPAAPSTSGRTSPRRAAGRRGGLGGVRKRLLHEAGVAVLADIHFGTRVPGEGQHVRFSYAASRQAIERAWRAWRTSSAEDTQGPHRVWRPSVTVAAVMERGGGRFLLGPERGSTGSWC